MSIDECSAQLICPLGRMDIMPNVPDSFHETARVMALSVWLQPRLIARVDSA